MRGGPARRPMGVTTDSAPRPSSPTSTSTTTTVMLSEPPRSLASVDQPLGRVAGIGLRRQDAGQLVDAHLVGKPVAAQDDPVTRLGAAAPTCRPRRRERPRGPG